MRILSADIFQSVERVESTSPMCTFLPAQSRGASGLPAVFFAIPLSSLILKNCLPLQETCATARLINLSRVKGNRVQQNHPGPFCQRRTPLLYATETR